MRGVKKPSTIVHAAQKMISIPHSPDVHERRQKCGNRSRCSSLSDSTSIEASPVTSLVNLNAEQFPFVNQRSCTPNNY